MKIAIQIEYDDQEELLRLLEWDDDELASAARYGLAEAILVVERLLAERGQRRRFSAAIVDEAQAIIAGNLEARRAREAEEQMRRQITTPPERPAL